MAMHALFKGDEPKSRVIQRMINIIKARDQIDEKQISRLSSCHMMVKGSENMLSDLDKEITAIKEALAPFTQRWLGIRANLIFAANHEVKRQTALLANNFVEARRLLQKIEAFENACEELNVRIGSKSILELDRELTILVHEKSSHMTSIEDNYNDAYQLAISSGLVVTNDLGTGVVSIVDVTIPKPLLKQQSSLVK